MTSADRQWWRRYDRYLNSQGWQLVREACFRRDGYRCCRCGLVGLPSNPLQAAHLTYKNYNATGRTRQAISERSAATVTKLLLGKNSTIAPSAIGCGNGGGVLHSGKRPCW